MFKQLSKNRIKIISKIIENEEFRVYLSNLNSHDFRDPKKIVSVKKAMRDHVLLQPFDDDKIEDSRVYLMVTPFEGRPDRAGLTSRDKYIIDIICPISSWLVESEGVDRPYVMAHEATKVIHNQYLGDMLGTAKVTGWRQIRVNSKFGAFSIEVTTDVSVLGC